MKRLNGAIALTLVLIISIILVTGGVGVLLLGIDSAYSSSRFNSLNLAELYAINCFEESLYRLEDNEAYTGTVSVTDNGEECQGVTTNAGANLKTLVVTSTSGATTFQEEYQVNLSTDPFTVSEQ